MEASTLKRDGPIESPKNGIPLASLTVWSILCVLSAHVISLKNGFVDFDDPKIFLNRPDLQLGFVDTLKAVFDWHRPDTWRPIRDMSHWLDYQLHGHSPFWSHLHNLVILGVLVALSTRFFYEFGIKARWLTLAITLAFVHPVQVETIAWVSGRKDLLAGIFFFAALITTLRFIRTDRQVFYGSATVAFYVLGLLSKGHIIVFPAIVLGLYWAVNIGKPDSLCGRKAICILMVCLMAISVFLAGRIADGGVSMPAEMAHDPRYQLTWQDRVQLPLRYVGLLLYPLELNHIYLVVLDEVHLALPWASILLMIVITSLIVRGIINRDSHTFFGCTALVLLLPFLHFRPGVVYMADRYLFLVTPFVSVISISFIAKRQWIRSMRTRVLYLVSTVLVMACIILSIGTHQAWQNSIQLWSRMVDVYPNHSWGYDRLGHALYEQGRVPEAAASWIAAADRTEHPTQYLRKSAISAMELGRLQWADALWSEILRLNPGDPEATSYRQFRAQFKSKKPRIDPSESSFDVKENEKRVDGNPHLGQ